MGSRALDWFFYSRKCPSQARRTFPWSHRDAPWAEGPGWPLRAPPDPSAAGSQDCPGFVSEAGFPRRPPPPGLCPGLGAVRVEEWDRRGPPTRSVEPGLCPDGAVPSGRRAFHPGWSLGVWGLWLSVGWHLSIFFAWSLCVAAQAWWSRTGGVPRRVASGSQLPLGLRKRSQSTRSPSVRRGPVLCQAPACLEAAAQGPAAH